MQTHISDWKEQQRGVSRIRFICLESRLRLNRPTFPVRYVSLHIVTWWQRTSCFSMTPVNSLNYNQKASSLVSTTSRRSSAGYLLYTIAVHLFLLAQRSIDAIVRVAVYTLQKSACSAHQLIDELAPPPHLATNGKTRLVAFDRVGRHRGA